MTISDLDDAVAAVVAIADLGIAVARKTGRNPRWPYVPVILDTDGRQRQIRGLAYATRQEAVAAAQRSLNAARDDLATKLRTPRYRALRRHHGLPEEIS